MNKFGSLEVSLRPEMPILLSPQIPAPSPWFHKASTPPQGPNCGAQVFMPACLELSS